MMRCLSILAILALSTACSGDVPADYSERANVTIMRTYEVPAENADEIGGSIRYLLGGDQGLGRATVLGRDRIAVAAPASVHAGVEQLIKAAVDASPEAPPRIRLEYWLVNATPSDGSPLPDSLVQIGDALAALSESIGPMNYARADYVTHVLRSGASSNVSGRELTGAVDAVARAGRIVGEFALTAPGGRRAVTQVDLVAGEVLVLATAGNRERGQMEASFSAFVVRATTF